MMLGQASLQRSNAPSPFEQPPLTAGPIEHTVQAPILHTPQSAANLIERLAQAKDAHGAPLFQFRIEPLPSGGEFLAYSMSDARLPMMDRVPRTLAKSADDPLIAQTAQAVLANGGATARQVGVRVPVEDPKQRKLNQEILDALVAKLTAGGVKPERIQASLVALTGAGLSAMAGPDNWKAIQALLPKAADAQGRPLSSSPQWKEQYSRLLSSANLTTLQSNLASLDGAELYFPKQSKDPTVRALYDALRTIYVSPQYELRIDAGTGGLTAVVTDPSLRPEEVQAIYRKLDGEAVLLSGSDGTLVRGTFRYDGKREPRVIRSSGQELDLGALMEQPGSSLQVSMHGATMLNAVSLVQKHSFEHSVMSNWMYDPTITAQIQSAFRASPDRLDGFIAALAKAYPPLNSSEQVHLRWTGAVGSENNVRMVDLDESVSPRQLEALFLFLTHGADVCAGRDLSPLVWVANDVIRVQAEHDPQDPESKSLDFMAQTLIALRALDAKTARTLYRSLVNRPILVDTDHLHTCPLVGGLLGLVPQYAGPFAPGVTTDGSALGIRTELYKEAFDPKDRALFSADLKAKGVPADVLAP